MKNTISIGLDTGIIMSDGKIKSARSITLNDLLMGDDNIPLKPLGISYEICNAYEMTTPKNDKIIVGSEHNIALKGCYRNKIEWNESRNYWRVGWNVVNTRKYKIFNPKKYKDKEDAYLEAVKFANTLTESRGKKYSLSVKEYREQTRALKMYSKAYKIGLSFPEKEIKLDPYFVGLWLGDGTAKCSSITNIDQEIIDWIYEYADKMGMRVRFDNVNQYYFVTKGTPHAGSNDILNLLRYYNIFDNKRIHDDFLFNTRDIRLKVLAGLLDSDGYYDPKNYYEIVQKRKDLANDILYLARSLGFGATIAEVEKTCTNAPNGPVTGIYHRVNIYGENLDEIPVLLERKKARPRQQIKDALFHGVECNPTGLRFCVKIELPENRRCIADNFIVI